MKLRFSLITLAFSLLIIGIAAITVGAQPDHEKLEFNEIELNEEQIKELKIRYEDLVNQRKGIIEKYKEFGVLSKEDATKMQEHMDRFMGKLEEDRFIPKLDKHKKAEKQE